MSNIPKVKYKFKGYKLPMELMVWDSGDPVLRTVYAIVPDHESPFKVMYEDSEKTIKFKHAALPEGVEPKKKKRKTPDLMGKVLVDEDGNREMVVCVYPNGPLKTVSICSSPEGLRTMGYRFEDGTQLGGESDVS